MLVFAMTKELMLPDHLEDQNEALQPPRQASSKSGHVVYTQSPPRAQPLLSYFQQLPNLLFLSTSYMESDAPTSSCQATSRDARQPTYEWDALGSGVSLPPAPPPELRCGWGSQRTRRVGGALCNLCLVEGHVAQQSVCPFLTSSFLS